jgi:hypothetical protein
VRYSDVAVVIHRYIFYKKKPKIDKRLDVILSKSGEVSYLISRRCYWCGREFINSRALALHLSPRRSQNGIHPCALAYEQLLSNLSSLYKLLGNYIIKTGNKYCVVGDKVCFKDLKRAYEYIIDNVLTKK